MATDVFKHFKVYFARPAAPLPSGRSERDANVQKLKRFVAENGMAGDLDAIRPSSAFGIVEIRCTDRLAQRLGDMPDVELLLEA